MSLLEIRDLKIHYRTRRGIARAVNGVFLNIDEDEYLGLVGESACGKTTVARAILGIMSPNSVLGGGEIVFRGQDLTRLDEKEMQKIRWSSISLISQSGMNALDPVQAVGGQIIDAINIHKRMQRRAALEQAAELFEAVGLEPNRLGDYPHQFSGGMRQRVMIAMALALNPYLIIADEPTTGLDVIAQDRILECIGTVRRASRKAMLLITHDMALVAENCHRIAVMYAGTIVESGETASVLQSPFCPYTMGLRNAFPSIRSQNQTLISIPGAPPNLLAPIQGCRFRERCPFRAEVCSREDPALRPVAENHQAACHFLERASEFRELAKDPARWQKSREATPGRGTTYWKGASFSDKQQAALEVHAVCKWFPIRSGFTASLLERGPRNYLKAVDNVSLRIGQGQIYGLAGESGCGKSTIAMLLSRLYEPTAGDVLIGGQSVLKASSGKRREFYRQVQIIFQDPYGSLNPRYTVSQTILEPLRIHHLGNAAEREEQAIEALTLAELVPPEEFWDRFPHQLSGGQRQRVAIARAIVLRPRFLITDEPVSMLDVSIRAGILSLLKRFARDLGIGILYISHDLSTMHQVCDRIGILYLGSIVEQGPPQAIVERPLHPYTKALISAIPIPDPGYHRKRVSILGEIPDPIHMPVGCRFAPRCSLATPLCKSAAPPLREIEPEHFATCLRAGTTLEKGANAQVTCASA